jgi:hypothetical protein
MALDNLTSHFALRSRPARYAAKVENWPAAISE